MDIFKFIGRLTQPIAILCLLAYLAFQAVVHWFQSEAVAEYHSASSDLDINTSATNYDFFDLKERKHLAVRLADGHDNVREHCMVVLHDMDAKAQLPAKHRAKFNDQIFDCRQTKAEAGHRINEIAVSLAGSMLHIEYPPTPLEGRLGRRGWVADVNIADEFGIPSFRAAAVEPVDVGQLRLTEKGHVQGQVEGKRVDLCCADWRLSGFTASKAADAVYLAANHGTSWTVWKIKR